MARPHIVFCTQEVWPFVEGGGIGRYTAETIRLLTPHADVSVVAPATWRARHAELVAAEDPRLPDARFAWFVEPDGDVRPFISWYHAYSHCCWLALRDLAREHTVDLVEFEDYRGMGAVAMQAKRGGAPELAGVPLVNRGHTTWEMASRVNEVDVTSPHARAVCAVERLALRFSDRRFVPTPETEAAYAELYGAQDLSPATIVTYPMSAPPPAADPPPLPLKLLYLGRLEARKGVAELIEAFTRLDRADVTLTLAGGDTQSGPSGGSMRDFCERTAAGDARVRFVEQVPPEGVQALIDDHHVVVMPSRFESFGYVAREALGANRPVITRRVGGLGMLHDIPGTGWPIDGAGADGILAVLEHVADHAEDVLAGIAAGAPRAGLTIERRTEEPVVGDYLALAAQRTADPEPPVALPAPSVLITSARGGDLAATLHSLAAQTRQPGEVVVVCDPTRLPPVAVAERISVLDVVPEGTSRLDARRRALALRAGDGPVLFLEAGQTLRPDFLDRASAALGSATRPAYVTTYGEGMTIGNAPLGNFAERVLGDPEASGHIALYAPEAIARGLPAPSTPGFEDDALLRELGRRGLFGAVLPVVLTGPVRPERAMA